MLCSPQSPLTTLKLSRLACSVGEYLKVLPEEKNEAGISPSTEVAWYPGGRKSQSQSQQKSNTKMSSAPLSLLKCLRNSLVHCHCGFKILYEADRRLGERSKNKSRSNLKLRWLKHLSFFNVLSILFKDNSVTQVQT